MKIDESWYKRPIGFPEHESAGGIVARIENGKVYLALTREDNYVEYILPKGHIEKGETLEQAARREIEEEAGFTELNLLEKIGVRERLNFKRTSWKKTHYFLFSTNQVEVTPSDNEYYQGIDWFLVEQLPAMFWPEQRELIETNSDKIVELMKKSQNSQRLIKIDGNERL